MPKGIIEGVLTNKTEFMRYLNEHEKVVPLLKGPLREYHSLHIRGNNFGYWLRYQRGSTFSRAYKWWLKHPELFDQVYS